MVSFIFLNAWLLAPKTQRGGGVYNPSERLESFKVYRNTYIQDQIALKAHLVLLF